MAMIPLTFLLAAAALYIGVLVVLGSTERKGWAIGFLGLLAYQEVLVGFRFGYGFDGLRMIQPFTAALIPPLAYLTFRRPVITPRLLLHLIPLACVLISVLLWVGALDLTLAFNNLFYAGLLAWLGLRGTDAMPWANFSRLHIITILLWLTVALLTFSGSVDAIISMDFWNSGGAHIGRIASWASVLGIIGALALYFLLRKTIKVPQEAGADADDEKYKQVFQRLQSIMVEKELYIDPEINLSRIARRLAIPVRDVSRAINSQAGDNVSQYVNSLRIDAACTLLKNPDTQITHVIYDVGYNSKSNFNREFARIKGMTPSEWRAQST